MNPWLVIPVKSIADGKSRLAPHLPAPTRRALNIELLSRSLVLAARFPGLDRTLVVSRCDDALAIARAQGSRWLVEDTPPSLNGALEQAIAHARPSGDSEVLVVSCDLPFACEADLRSLVVCSRAMAGGVALASDREGFGTNALCIPRSASFTFRYGPSSRLRHREEAARRGLPFCALPLTTLAFDVDTIDDYREWRNLAAAAAPASAQMLPALPDPNALSA